MNLREQLKQSKDIEKEISYTEKLEARYLDDLVELEDNKEVIESQKETIEIQKKYIKQLELSLLVQNK